MKDLVYSEGMRMISARHLNHQNATDLTRSPNGKTESEAYSVR